MKEIKTFVVENTWLKGLDHGWGNGYAIVPKGHPLHGKHYSDYVKCDFDPDFNGSFINLLCSDHEKAKNNEFQLCLAIDVHYGLTFSEAAKDCPKFPIPKGYEDGWVFGFDTAHLDDTIHKWPKEAVEREAEKLKVELEKFNT